MAAFLQSLSNKVIDMVNTGLAGPDKSQVEQINIKDVAK